MAGGKTRAGFLGTGAAALGGAALAGAWRVDRAGASTTTAAATAAAQVANGTVNEGAFDARFFGDQFAFTFGGAAGGKIDAVSGGNPSSDVVTEKLGPDNIQHKHIAGVKYEDVSVTVGAGMSKNFYEWIKSSFDGQATRRTGSVSTYDKNGVALGSGQFTNALLEDIGFPALDASSKDAAKMTVKFQPETTRFATLTGKAPALGGGVADISAGNFKLEIDGLVTTDLSLVDAFTVVQPLVPNPGDGTSFQFEAGALQFPNLAFTFPNPIDQSWIDYFQDFVVKGDNGDQNERNGTLHLLDKKSNELFTIGLSHLGIFALTPQWVQQGGGASNIRRVRAEMYVEQISFQYTSAATFG